jgi:hypothetical protein
MRNASSHHETLRFGRGTPPPGAADVMGVVSDAMANDRQELRRLRFIGRT